MKNLTDNQQVKAEMRLDAYEAPAIEVIEVEIEQGFLVSPGGGGDGPLDPSW
jgi:hypothetical protein